MTDSPTSAALRSALQFVASGDIPSHHKAVLIDAVTQVLRFQESARTQSLASAPLGAAWQEQEVATLQSFLQGRVAKNWQQGDEFLTRLALQLHRSPRDVRAKAAELGLGAGVDYGLARILTRTQETQHEARVPVVADLGKA
jgi:hypothetical protein